MKYQNSGKNVPLAAKYNYNCHPARFSNSDLYSFNSSNSQLSIWQLLALTEQALIQPVYNNDPLKSKGDLKTTLYKGNKGKTLDSNNNHFVIRPLLGWSRNEITRICKYGKIPVYPDASNQSLQYSRNRIRKQIIPSFQLFFNPQVEDALFQFAELASKEQNLISDLLL